MFQFLKTKKFWLTAVITIIVLAALGVIFQKPLMALWAKIPFGKTSYYAVQLNNNQVYFGHIKSISSDTIVLIDSFYFEAYDAPASASASGNLQVQSAPQKIYNFTKRGATSPMLTDNKMFINRSAVLFWEKLSPASDMSKWIDQGKKQK